MRVYNYTVIFEPDEEGGYNVVVPAIPEICTCGETLEEAKVMAEDAIRCYLESALELGGFLYGWNSKEEDKGKGLC